MAKKKTEAVSSENSAKFRVSGPVPPKEILAAEERGEEIFFEHEAFVELPDDVIQQLSFSNQRNYWLAKGAYEQSLKNETRKELFGDLQVMDPLGGKAAEKLRIVGTPKGFHDCWKRPDEVAACEEKGYELVSNDDKTRTPGATHTSTSRTIRRKDGTDDLVLMRIPERVFQQHLEAVSFESRKRAGAGFGELKRSLKRVHRDLELVDSTTTEEVKEVVPPKQAAQ